MPPLEVDPILQSGRALVSTLLLGSLKHLLVAVVAFVAVLYAASVVHTRSLTAEGVAALSASVCRTTWLVP